MKTVTATIASVIGVAIAATTAYGLNVKLIDKSAPQSSERKTSWFMAKPVTTAETDGQEVRGESVKDSLEVTSGFDDQQNQTPVEHEKISGSDSLQAFSLGDMGTVVASVAKDGSLSISSVDRVPSGWRYAISRDGDEVVVNYRSATRELVFRVSKTQSGITGRFMPETTQSQTSLPSGKDNRDDRDEEEHEEEHEEYEQEDDD